MRAMLSAHQSVGPVRVPGPEKTSEFAPVCDENPYPLLKPGKYAAQSVHARIYRDPQFRRWTVMIRFQLLASGGLACVGQVCGFFNLGQDENPRAGRRSRYWRAWVIANGAQPRKRQVLSPRVFKGKIFEVEIETVRHGQDGREHPIAMQYSTVREILARRGP
jgi:hypothetical protein